MKRLAVYLLATGWDASPFQATPCIKFAGTHLYTWVKTLTVRVKERAQEHNNVSGQGSSPERLFRSRAG